MAGILDSKSRVIDFALTPQGRRQLASGQLIFDRATVSDRSSFYEGSETGAADASNRIYFETYSTLSDQVTLEADDSGQLLPFGGANLQFASAESNIAGTSASNFSSLKVLISDDPEDRQQTAFKLDGTQFVFYPSMPDLRQSPESRIDAIESVLFDKRLAKKKNFLYLPPENESGSRLGHYTDIRQKFLGEEFSDLMSGEKGTKYQAFVTRFRETSPSNSLNIQVYQTNQGAGIRKLDLIDYGRASFGGKDGHVFFAGRVLLNSFDFPVFVNILTIVLT